MRTATALTMPAPRPTFAEPIVPSAGQIPLPFPAMTPVLPVPVERGRTGPLRDRSAVFLQALVEVLTGERPARQLAAWTTPGVYNQLQSRLAAHARVPRRVGAGRGARVVSVHIAMVSDEAAEVCGRMVHRGRSRAIALRLELHTTHRGDQVWRCSALEWA